MNIIIVGVDHLVQENDPPLKCILSELTDSKKAVVIGEEYPGLQITVARQVAEEHSIPWIQIDMNSQQRRDHGIEQRLSQRLDMNYARSIGTGEFRYDENGQAIPDQNTYFEVEDGIRENFWLDRIEELQLGGSAVIVCGAAHARFLAAKAQRRGHPAEIIFHPPGCADVKVTVI
jgi:hypothetical protein